MEEENSLINLGDLAGLSKPATVLIEKVSNAVGVLYEPYRIIKKAKAEAKAEKIKALASIEVNELEQRGLNRFVQQQARKQKNIEQITAQAASSLKEDAKVEDIDEDWIAHLFKQCDTISDKEMQTLWANLLSGEASKPGTFSKRTVNLVASLDKKDARLFTDFCQFVWSDFPLIYDLENKIYKNAGINFLTLKHLDAIGLISFSSALGYKLEKLNKITTVSYFGSIVLVTFPKDKNNELKAGEAMLTQAGKELKPICGAIRNNEFYEYIIKKWQKEGLNPIKINKD